jgi:hypothetical protein
VRRQPPTALVDAIDMVTLWDLLIALCFAMPIGGALASAKLAKTGFVGYALSVAVGLVLGLLLAWIMRTVGKIIAARIKQSPRSPEERYFRVLYFAAMLWIALGLFLGGWLSSVAMRFAF